MFVSWCWYVFVTRRGTGVVVFLCGLSGVVRQGGGQEGKKEEAAEDFGDGGGRHRVLIFAQMKTMLDIIENDLFRKEMPGVTWLRMDGEKDTRRVEKRGVMGGVLCVPSISILVSISFCPTPLLLRGLCWQVEGWTCLVFLSFTCSHPSPYTPRRHAKRQPL
jgi:hypothetical protein